MPGPAADDRRDAETLDPTLPVRGAADDPLLGPEEDDEDLQVEPSYFEDPRKIAQTVAVVALLVIGIYFLFPKLIDDQDAIERLDRADPLWLVVALVFSIAMFFAYVALFKGVVGERLRLRWKESYEITMAGLAATRLFSAGGAGGIVLTYWALRKAGMPKKESAARMVTFLVLLYAVYMVSLIVAGTGLRTGLFPGEAPAGLTVAPAIFAGVVICVFLLFALVPGDLERRFSRSSQRRILGRTTRRLATVPSTFGVGTRQAIGFVREPSRGALALIGAVGFWAANIAILWASFKAFGVEVPLAVVVQGFFIGMFANLIPLPGGVGGVDAGMLGAFALFDVHGIFAAILTYRVFAFWLPIPPGIVAFLQLRRTVRRWEAERTGPSVGTDIAESLPGTAITSESKV